jgi:2-keto-4-pentenoate hydratase/2-oxohepta-3-ene-1,7-dioic acid hydratase in catechol pathway
MAIVFMKLFQGGKTVEKYVRFKDGSRISYGLVDGNKIIELKGKHFEEFKVTDIEHDFSSVELLVPCTPTKVIYLGQNYKDIQLAPGTKLPKEPQINFGPTTGIINNMEDIIKWPITKELNFEGELVIVIGRKAQRVSRTKARDYIWGYTIANDITAKDLQREFGWTRAKCHDTFLPVGPCIVKGIDPQNLEIASYLNGELVQKGSSRDLLFEIDYLISFISHISTLLPGDIITTGTPGGQGGGLNIGDKVEIEITGIGRLTNSCKKNSSPWNLERPKQDC